jgi:hypothetical protein
MSDKRPSPPQEAPPQAEDKQKHNQREEVGVSDFPFRQFFGPAVRHLPLLVSAAVSVLLVLRIAGASKFQVPTALALVGASNAASVVLALFLWLFTTIMLYVGLVSVAYVVDRLKVVWPARLWAAIVARITHLVLILALAAVVLPWFDFAIIGFLAVVYLVGSRASIKSSAVSSVWALVAGLTGLLIYQSVLWLPAEVLRVTGRKPIVGYVVRDTGTWVTILTETDRRIVYIQSGRLLGRSICTVRSQSQTRALVSLLTGERAHIPRCPGGV